MDDTLRFASIDIGSNAVRLFFCYVFETKLGPIFKKASLIRLPIRLGEDSFHQHEIEEHKVEELIAALKAFKQLMVAYRVISYKACATSAMRDAINSSEIISKIERETGIDIEVIDGQEEADLIFENEITKKLSNLKTQIYMDVGGGSTEFTVFHKGSRKYSRSFNIGTIRLKDNLVEKQSWKELKNWLSSVKKEYKPSTLIGSGGNINTLFKMSFLHPMVPLSKRRLKKLYKDLKALSYDEKIALLKMRPDRADVIIPATELFLLALSKTGATEIIVPQVGLVDGIVHELYKEYLEGNPKRPFIDAT